MTTPEEDLQAGQEAGRSIVSRLLGSRIVLFGTTETDAGDIMLGAQRPDGSLIEVVISVEDGELVICEVEREFGDE